VGWQHECVESSEVDSNQARESGPDCFAHWFFSIIALQTILRHEFGDLGLIVVQPK
jgi:hypothetical protein